MRVLKQPPPNFKKILEHFDVDGEPICYTYGDTIYSPQGTDIPPHILVHEHVHELQQAQNPDEWWDEYLVNPAFRLEQELEAYQAQYAHLKKILHDRNTLFRLLHKLAQDLSGKMYNNLMTHAEAMKAIKK